MLRQKIGAADSYYASAYNDDVAILRALQRSVGRVRVSSIELFDTTKILAVFQGGWLRVTSGVSNPPSGASAWHGNCLAKSVWLGLTRGGIFATLNCKIVEAGTPKRTTDEGDSAANTVSVPGPMHSATSLRFPLGETADLRGQVGDSPSPRFLQPYSAS